MYAYWVCAARETPIFSPEFPFRSISFSQITKNLFWSITILHFLADFAIPETIIFKNSLISTRSSPPTVGSARTQFRRLAFSCSKRVKLVPEPRSLTLKMAQARSGAPHFHTQNGSSSFRSPAFSCSTGSSFRSPGQFFTLHGTYLPKFGVSTPPPPPSLEALSPYTHNTN